MFFWKSKKDDEDRFSLSLLVLFILFLPALLILWVVRLLLGQQAQSPRQAGREKERHRAAEKSRRASEKTALTKGGKSPEEVKKSASQKREKTKQDDLTRIEGIGPKTVEVLRGHGITTFRQLANTSVERLNEIMEAAGFRINPPDTWPEQARLAADDQMEDLDALQDQLHAGRREKK